ncbi:hypothetical protein QAD02_000499 [Eretmocerus hayati]|uniref:Uncharacterized protein n=1 Tax=Eretmocerus hayati TaxID=131215 RepID=A0ACC2NI55_9HYME|nr:hypothetical protein QAD02_000499 [Eretmocerus hayati]
MGRNRWENCAKVYFVQPEPCQTMWNSYDEMMDCFHKEIHKVVKYMGGQLENHVMASVDVLVTNTVMSAKYEEAAELRIKIVTIEWLKFVWERKCPVFLNLIVTNVNLSTRQTEEVQRLVHDNGGEYVEHLNAAEVKLVIISKECAVSSKVKFAMQNQIPCVGIEWIRESVNAGFSLPICNYLMRALPTGSSTGKRRADPTLNVSKARMIPVGDGERVCANVTKTRYSWQQRSIDSDSSQLGLLEDASSGDRKGGCAVTCSATSCGEEYEKYAKNHMRERKREICTIASIGGEEFVPEKVFKGISFIVTGYLSEDIDRIVYWIRKMGGVVIEKNDANAPDFEVVPILGSKLEIFVGAVVTELFIGDCIYQEKLVDPRYYHHPIIVYKDTKPLINCVICASTYGDFEKLYLPRLSEVLGARYQEQLCRETDKLKNTTRTTHLVCPVPQGDKYAAAVEWGLPAVTTEWLLDCSPESEHLEETPYLVGETKGN